VKQFYLNCAILALAFVFGTLPATAAPKNLFRHKDAVPNEYIVVLHSRDQNAVAGTAHSIASSYGGEVLAIFENILYGFALRAPAGIAERIASDPRVRFVEENHVITLSASRSTTVNSFYMWHLDRFDEDDPSIQDGTYEYCHAGRNSTIYIVDGGLDHTHSEFMTDGVSRVIYQKDYAGGGGLSTNRCVNNAGGWHGTAVGSVAAGNLVGVASEAKIVDVRTHSCSGVSNLLKIVEAFNWINSDTRRNITHPQWGQPQTEENTDPLFVNLGVVNMSSWRKPLDGEGSGYPTIEVATNDLVQAGFPFVTSANNYSVDACKFAPANLGVGGPGAPGRYADGSMVNVPPSVLTVGGTRLAGGVDYRWHDHLDRDGGSNSGGCISVWAPAADIYAARHSRSLEQENRYGVASGTSFSSPMVAGLIARYQQWFVILNGRIPTPDEVYQWVLARSWPAVPNSATPGHYKCINASNDIIGTFSLPCPSGYAPWTELSPDGYFPASSNATAGVAHWQEGACRKRTVSRP
jgi:hypothetical protein